MRRETFDLVRSPFISHPQRGLSDSLPRARSVTKIQEESRTAYTNLIFKFKEIVVPALQDESAQVLMDRILKIISNSRTLPRIDSQAVADFLPALERSIAASAAVARATETNTAAMAALLVQLKQILGPNDILDPVRSREAIRLEMASYMSWLNITEAETDNVAFGGGLKDLENRYKNGITEIEARLSEFNSRALELQSRDVRLREALDQSSLQFEEQMKSAAQSISANEVILRQINTEMVNLEARVDASRINIEAFKTAVLEEVRGRETRKLWSNRDTEAWNAFKVSAALLFALLVGIPLIGLWQLDWILSMLRHIGEATTEGIPKTESGTLVTVATISRLFVITFPLVLYLWVVRLVVRFNARSLSLHDDARQRQTMLDTYFILLEREAATTEERGLILNALFRPGPGQGADNLEPPTFTDFIGKANPVK